MALPVSMMDIKIFLGLCSAYLLVSLLCAPEAALAVDEGASWTLSKEPFSHPLSEPLDSPTTGPAVEASDHEDDDDDDGQDDDGEDSDDDPELQAREMRALGKGDFKGDAWTPAHWTADNERVLGIFEKTFAGQYDKINLELAKNVNSDGVADNMEFAAAWLKSLSSGLNLFKGDLKKALQQFISLSQITHGHRCGREAYAILSKNIKAIRNMKEFHSLYGPLRRVDRIVFRYAVEHAAECLPQYPARMVELYSKKEFEPLLGIERAFKNIYRGSEFMNYLLHDEKGMCKKLREPHPKATSEGQAALDFLISVTKISLEAMCYLMEDNQVNSEPGRLETDVRKLKPMLDEFLIGPCKVYVREVGVNVMKPAKLDFSVLDDKDTEGIKDQYNTKEFCIGKERYSMCKFIIARQKHILHNLANILRKLSYHDVIMKISSQAKYHLPY